MPGVLPLCPFMRYMALHDHGYESWFAYGLDGLGIEFHWELNCLHLQTGPGAHPVSSTTSNGSSLTVKRLGSGFENRLPSSMGRDSYGLDGPGIEFRWGARFSAPVQIGPGPHTASYTMSTGSFSGVKRPGRGVLHSLSSRVEVNERV
jgi:hypothetical protein